MLYDHRLSPLGIMTWSVVSVLDKVYAKILSVSLLFSLYGAGAVSADVALTPALRDVLSPMGANEVLVDPAESTARPDINRRAFLKLRNVLSCISNRITTFCAKRYPSASIDGLKKISSLPQTLCFDAFALGRLSLVPNGRCSVGILCCADIDPADGHYLLSAPVRAGPLVK